MLFCISILGGLLIMMGQHARSEALFLDMFPVSLEDIAGASLFSEMKAITLMRYIRKALEDKTFVKAR